VALMRRRILFCRSPQSGRSLNQLFPAMLIAKQAQDARVAPSR
jgi:hypothetical protein